MTRDIKQLYSKNGAHFSQTLVPYNFKSANHSRQCSFARKKKILESADAESSVCTKLEGCKELDRKEKGRPNITLKEAKKLEEEMEITIEEMDCSQFYVRLSNQLENDTSLQEKFESALGNHSSMTMVIYALGTLEFNNHSQYQLALAILLKRDFSHWIGEIEVFDPLFSPADVIVFEKLGCKVLTVNENCRRKVEKPTLFFMPSPFYHLVANLLEANWCPSRINQMILLTESFKDLCRNCNDTNEYEMHFIRYVRAIQRNTKEVAIPAKYSYQYSKDTHICHFSWHFFNVKPRINMERLLPGFPSDHRRFKFGRMFDKSSSSPRDYKDLERLAKEVFLDELAGKEIDYLKGKQWIYPSVARIPCEYRWKSHTPPAGWMKLNISGKGCDENGPAGYAGIFRNENNERLAVYYGRIEEDETDSIHATIEALRCGFKCLKNMPFVGNLIVEGDNLRLIRWMNFFPEPPHDIQQAFGETASYLPKGMRCRVYHIYREANLPAIKLAMRGSKLEIPHLWVADKS